MSTPTEALTTSLRQHGYSLTKARQVVFIGLQGHEPQTMHELVARCPGIDRASIYRTVTLFEKLGIIQRLQIGWKYKLELTDSFAAHHHHLSCVGCGKIIPLPEDAHLENTLLSMATAHGFVAQDHQLEIRGTCLACQQITTSGVAL